MNEEYFEQSELAFAAYANLEEGVNVKDELELARFSSTQANFFIEKYTVEKQYNDPKTGLSATAFKSTGPDQETFLAIRGVELSRKF